MGTVNVENQFAKVMEGKSAIPKAKVIDRITTHVQQQRKTFLGKLRDFRGALDEALSSGDEAFEKQYPALLTQQGELLAFVVKNRLFHAKENLIMAFGVSESGLAAAKKSMDKDQYDELLNQLRQTLYDNYHFSESQQISIDTQMVKILEALPLHQAMLRTASNDMAKLGERHLAMQPLVDWNEEDWSLGNDDISPPGP